MIVEYLGECALTWAMMMRNGMRNPKNMLVKPDSFAPLRTHTPRQRHPSIKERLQPASAARVSSICPALQLSKMNQKEAWVAQKSEEWGREGKRAWMVFAALEIGGQQNESARRTLKWSMLLPQLRGEASKAEKCSQSGLGKTIDGSMWVAQMNWEGRDSTPT